MEKLYLETYIERLKPNPTPEDLKNIVELKNVLFDLRMKKCSSEISKDWKSCDLEKVLKNLKDSKARDAHGHVYELFKFGGKNLNYRFILTFSSHPIYQVYLNKRGVKTI